MLKTELGHHLARNSETADARYESLTIWIDAAECPKSKYCLSISANSLSPSRKVIAVASIWELASIPESPALAWEGSW